MTAPRILAAHDAATAGYTLLVVSEADEVRAAQRLRYRVFAEEMGARLNSPEPGLDVDALDEFCDHLVVREDATGEIVGTYRMLPPDRAKAAGRLYAEGEFDVSAIAPLRDILVETGRSCVHPDHRTGAVINLMWSGIARYLHLTGHRWLAGCASVALPEAAAVAQLGLTRHLAPPRLRVTPRVPFDIPVGTEPAPYAKVPPLLRGYLRLGAWVCGPPAYDADFQCADLFLLVSLDRVDPRYLRHYLGDTR
jgi:putative hemolysin